MKTLTVFTCTYNRAHTLSRTYESLCNQTSKDFCWLIVDDGSEDNTKELVNLWIKENEMFPIKYVHKKNEGLPSGYNKAIETIETELCIGIDSDDAMPTEGVEKIIGFWKENGSESHAGIIGLDYYFNGEGPLGGFLPERKEIHLKDLKTGKYKHRGDTKQVHRTSLLKKFAPMPIYKGEKDSNPAYLFYQVDKNYPLLILNECLCLVEYQLGGMSESIYKQYKRSPKSYLLVRKLYMEIKDVPFIFTLKQAIHFVSSKIFINEYNLVKDSPKKLLTLLAIPLGILLNIYIRFKTRKS